MTITAYTTKSIEPGTLAAGLIVMEAWRGGGNRFPLNFTSHPGLKVAHEGETYSFNAGSTDLRSPVTLALHRGSDTAVTVTLNPGETLREQISAQVKTTGKAPRLDH